MRVYSNNPPASEDFYKMLGFKPQPDEGKVERFDVSASQWVEVTPLTDPKSSSRMAEVGFTTRNAASLEKYLKAKGVTILEPLKHGEFTVADPEGNRVAFVQAGSQRFITGNRDGVGESTSQRIIHVGFVVKSAAAEDHFYRDLLGFRPYWHGGMKDGQTDWVSLQVPDGSDWLEYMLNTNLTGNMKKDLHTVGVQDHFSLGIEHMQDAEDVLARNGCATTSQASNCTKTVMGKDGKMQMNVYDPDQTRVEYMEFKPTGPVCCSEFTAKHPTQIEDK